MEPTLGYKFEINAYTPATLPMARLAEYMADLAKLLGFRDNVHFSHLEEGSSVLAYKIDRETAIEVRERVAKADAGVGPFDAVQAIQNINKRLIEDRTDGYIREDRGAEIIRFPGYQSPLIEEPAIKTPMQPDTLDGVVQRIGRLSGGLASVLLETHDSQVFACRTYKGTARKLAHHIFSSEVRLTGYARWHRSPRGRWALNEFFIQDFEVLKDEKLSDVIAELHRVEGSEWMKVDDPWQELANIRGSSKEDYQ